MNLSRKWLSDYVKIDASISPRAFCEAMTMSGSKVEGYHVEGAEIEKVVVGRVNSVEKHPDADKLVVCLVDVGAEQTVQIVTGATNVNAGDFVPVCLDGAKLPGGKSIRRGKLRGVMSEGMLCSLDELGLTEHDFPYAIEDGIFILQPEDGRALTLGEPIQSAIGLDDMCVEFEITSNRPDCLSVTGLAREAAATFGVPLTLPSPVVEHETGDIHELLSVEVQNPTLCPRYVARMVKNIKIAPSPRWMRERLRASGVRPINNIVDITNYVMLEYGQPMHAFDFKYIKGGKIIVRNAKENEPIMTLDGVQRTLSSDMLAICDAEAPSGVAGVMGGEFSSIMDDTNTIVFESACFNGPSVRITAKKLGMRTEASGRFEKGLDPQTCIPAVQRACQLVELLHAGEVVGGIIDVDHSDKTPVHIPLMHDWINTFLGIEVPREEMVRILNSVECSVDENDIVTAPSFRADLQHKADIAEEIARFYGYNKIPSTAIRGTAQAQLTPLQRFEEQISRSLLALGCTEAATYSFISPKYYDKIRLPADSPLRNSVIIRNPLGEDTSVMRTTALPSMLEVLSRNYSNRNLCASMFELAAEYVPTAPDQLPEERQKIIIGMYGGTFDFYALKGVVEGLLSALGGYAFEVQPVTDNPTFHPGRCAALTLAGKTLGILGEVHPVVAESYGMDGHVLLAELDEATLFRMRRVERQYRPLPRFPVTTRDIAVICDEDMPVQTLQKTIVHSAGKLLDKVELFDVYNGAQVPMGKKSVAYNITLRSPEKTLSEDDISAVMGKILLGLSSVGAELRS